MDSASNATSNMKVASPIIRTLPNWNSSSTNSQVSANPIERPIPTTLAKQWFRNNFAIRLSRLRASRDLRPAKGRLSNDLNRGTYLRTNPKRTIFGQPLMWRSFSLFECPCGIELGHDRSSEPSGSNALTQASDARSAWCHECVASNRSRSNRSPASSHRVRRIDLPREQRIGTLHQSPR